MRYHMAVIKNLLELVPEQQQEFRSKVEAVIKDNAYKAPEQMEVWIEMAHVLEENLPFPPKEKWQWDVAALWMDTDLMGLAAKIKETIPAFKIPYFCNENA